MDRMTPIEAVKYIADHEWVSTLTSPESLRRWLREFIHVAKEAKDGRGE